MVGIYQVRAELAKWVGGQVSLSEFEDWFVPATWDIQGSAELVNLVNEIELRISEYSSGEFSKQELRDQMRKLLGDRPIVTVQVIDLPPIRSGWSLPWQLQEVPAV
jgi:hypothetical protein